MSKKQANLVCLIVAAIWGGGFIATDAALQTFDPFTVLMIRFMGASLVSIVVCLCSHVKVSKQALFRGSISVKITEKKIKSPPKIIIGLFAS